MTSLYGHLFIYLIILSFIHSASMLPSPIQIQRVPQIFPHLHMISVTVTVDDHFGVPLAPFPDLYTHTHTHTHKKVLLRWKFASYHLGLKTTQCITWK